MGKPIRVLLANHPRLMRELILSMFSEQPDIEIVGEVADEADVMGSIERTQPDVVVIAQDDFRERPRLCNEVLHQWPIIRIIAVGPHKDHLVHYWTTLDIHSDDIEASEESILGVLRTNVNSAWGLA